MPAAPLTAKGWMRRAPVRIPAFLGHARPLVRPRLLRPARPAWDASGGISAQTAASAHVRNLVVREQQLDNWCWAATTQAVLHKLGTNVTQAAIAGRHTGGVCELDAIASQSDPDWPVCATASCPRTCNDTHALKQVMAGHGIAFDRVPVDPGSDHRARIKFEIDSDRPVPLMLYTWGKLQHFCVIGGYSGDSASDYAVYYPIVDRAARQLTPIRVSWTDLANGFVSHGIDWWCGWLYPVQS